MYAIYLMILLQLLTPVILQNPKQNNAFVWGYRSNNGPSSWGQYYPLCNLGKNQSPIDIEPVKANYKQNLQPLQAARYTPVSSGTKTTITNNGVSILIRPSEKYQPILIHPLNKSQIYKAHSLHFHWGAQDNKGSETTIQGKSFPIEIHIVHYNVKYQKLERAISQSDGLAVVGIFAEVGKGNSGFKWLVQHLQQVQYMEETISAKGFDYSSFLPDDLSKYYTFHGSLTTPPCEETVRWIVMAQPTTISKDQMMQFRKLYSTSRKETHPLPLINNYRPLQLLNNRTIYSSFDASHDKTNAKSITNIIIVAAVTVICLFWLFR